MKYYLEEKNEEVDKVRRLVNSLNIKLGEVNKRYRYMHQCLPASKLSWLDQRIGKIKKQKVSCKSLSPRWIVNLWGRLNGPQSCDD